MKKKLLAALCAAVLSLSLLAVPSSAAGSLVFLALNDTLEPQSAQLMPIQSGGTMYVPAAAFSNRVTGISFGVYYTFKNNGECLHFYTFSGKWMIFDMTDGTVTTELDDTPVPGKVVRQGGNYYVPAQTVCRHFGLSCSLNTTDYGPLLRIKDGSAILNDSLFISSAAPMMRSQYNNYYYQGAGSGPGTTEPVNPGTTPGVEPAPQFSLYVGLRAYVGADITPTLNALAGANASAVVFFPVDSLASLTDQIRQAAGRGHKVGLIPSGNTVEDRLESVRKGEDLLSRILRQETWFLLSGDKELADAGYLCWSPGHTISAGDNAQQIYQGIVDYGKKKSAGRVLLDSRAAGAAGALARLAQDGDTFLTSLETRY
ncbi:MAG: hypothetical protein HUJ67_04585 [Ruminiclostridium sp.]|nr:hypothetical protein [Ruminiclostridium sp.]